MILFTNIPESNIYEGEILTEFYERPVESTSGYSESGNVMINDDGDIYSSVNIQGPTIQIPGSYWDIIDSTLEDLTNPPEIVFVLPSLPGETLYGFYRFEADITDDVGLNSLIVWIDNIYYYGEMDYDEYDPRDTVFYLYISLDDLLG
ncbi:MAG: hypothetical protein ACTSVZ_11610 [Promethearchaeota archaeon]